MTEPTDSNGTKTKILAAVIGSVLATVLSAGGGMMYRHEVTQLEQARDISKLRARVYRERVRSYEYHERYMQSVVQLIELRDNKEGLSVVDKSRLNFYKGQQQMVREEKGNYIETWKHEGQ
jgi:hypothetical protein